MKPAAARSGQWLWYGSILRHWRRLQCLVFGILSAAGLVSIGHEIVSFHILQPQSPHEPLSDADVNTLPLLVELENQASHNTERWQQQQQQLYPTPNNRQHRCAILLYGLPRSFQALVLPSVIEYIVKTNARYGCDYFVHYNVQRNEVAGRSGRGGNLNPHEIRLLKNAVLETVKNVTSSVPTRMLSTTAEESLLLYPDHLPKVVFSYTTNEDFERQYGNLTRKIREERLPNNQLKYFPYNARTYRPESTDNIIKMWHSQESVWNLMMQQKQHHQQQDPYPYTRVAMFRSDVVYVTPIDIYKTPGGQYDVENRVSVVPSFARYPVNDRMIYGPACAVHIWAARRFEWMEEHVMDRCLKMFPGYCMHSERFVHATLFPAIRQQTNTTIEEDASVCFLRARADETVWINDCQVPNFRGRFLPILNRLTGRTCRMGQLTLYKPHADCSLPRNNDEENSKNNNNDGS